MENLKISGSIVVYKEDPKVLENSIKSFLGLRYDKELIIIDNSPSKSLKNICLNFEGVRYFHMNKNIGFGRAHNLAFKKLENKSNIHLIMNPDIYFDSYEMENFLKWFHKENDVILAIPKVLYPNKEMQNVCRKIPTISSIIKRQFIKNYDVIITPDNSIIDIPFAHGCFFAFKSFVFDKLGGFDERFFMYMEDVDIWIRSKYFGRTVINTNYNIYHLFRRGSKKNLRLFFIHLFSLLKFFRKYSL